jgi:hypothetical protein
MLNTLTLLSCDPDEAEPVYPRGDDVALAQN